MKVSSFKLKVKSFLKNLSTVYGLLSGAKLYKLSLRGAERRSNLKRNKIATPFGLAMTCKHNECVCINKSGFTLIEIIMIMIVVAIAIPALLIVLGQEAKQGVNAELQVSATNVAQALIEEIKTKRWDENNPPPPYTTPLGPEEAWDINHTNYDDVDDYHNLYANSVSNDFISVGGVTYTRDVQVCYVCGVINLPTCPAVDLNTCLTAPTTTDYKRIRVIISNSTLGSVNLVTVVTNY